MTLYERIIDDCKLALKNRDTVKLSVLRVLISDIQRKYDKNYDDSWVIDVIRKTIKYTEEVNNDKSILEKNILNEYLPIQIGKKDVLTFIKNSNISYDKRMQLIKIALNYFPKGSLNGNDVRTWIEEYYS